MRVYRRLLGVVVAVIAGCVGASSALAVSTTVTVHAENAAGEPITGTLYAWRVGAGSYPGNHIVNGVGSITITADTVGDYRLGVSASNMDDLQRWYVVGTPGGTPVAADGTAVTLDGTPVEFSMTLPLIGKLSGRVLGPNGSPMANLAVFRSRFGGSKSTTTNANGEYDFGFVQPGTYSLATGSTDTVAAGQMSLTMPATGAITQDFNLVSHGTVSGTLTDAATGAPIANLRVAAYRKSSTGYLGAAFTDADGHFTIPRVTSDVILQYTDLLNGYPSGWNGGAVLAADATAIPTVPAGEVLHNESLTASSDPRLGTHTLSGVVTASGGGPLGGIEVTATDGINTQSTLSDRLGRWALNTPDGEFTVGFAQGGNWSQLTPAALPWFSQYYPAAWDSAHATKVVVAGGSAVDTVDTTMVRSGMIHIPIVVPSGVSMMSGYSLVDDAGVTVNVVTPAQNGTSDIRAFVKPGTYRVFITGTRMAGSATVALVPQWYAATGPGRAASLATPVAVAADQTVNGSSVSLPVSFAALAAPTISGTAAAGNVLTGSIGIWNQQTGSTYTTRWMRGSTTMGTASSYRVQLLDAGALLRLTVRGTNSGLIGSAFREVRVAKLATTTTALVSSPSSRTVRLAVRVRGSGLTPAGRVVIRRGTVIVASRALVSGRVTVLVTAQPSGRQTYRVSYLGTSRHRTSRTALIGVSVR